MRQAVLPQSTNTGSLGCAPDSAWERAGADWFAAMQAGDFPRAWEASDRVLELRRPEGRDEAGQPYHLRWIWDGSAVDGREVLVRCYHGLGDTVQFCRFLLPLRRRAAHVTLEVQAELVPLMRLAGVADSVVPFDGSAPLPPAPCTLEIMELCHALRIAPEPVAYLPIPRPIPRRASGDGLRVGLCWQVNAGWRPQRSVPAAAAARLLPVAGVTWRSLQKGAAFDGMLPCPSAVLDTAGVIAGLDLVVTVDTMVAHLAGAQGVPVWLLLDAAPDWRWLAGGRASPWYPGIRKYCQERAGEWDAPLRAVAADLTAEAGAKSLKD